MTRQQVKQFVLKSLKSQFEGEGVKPLPFVVGRFGVGKSSMASEVARELGKAAVFVVASGVDPTLSHFPVIVDGEVTYKIWRGWMDDETIVVLDEFDKVHPSHTTFLLPILSIRKIQDNPVRCGIILLGNSTDILTKIPALKSRLQTIVLDDPTVTEVVSFLTSKYNYFLQEDHFRHTFSLVTEFLDREGLSDELTPRQVDALLSYAAQGVMELWEYEPFMGSLFPKFSTFVNEIKNFPSPHSSHNEIISFIKLPISTTHFYFVRLFISHIFTCSHPHPFTLVQFLKTLKRHNPSLLDASISAIISFQNTPQYFEVVSSIADDPELSNIVTKVAREQI